jgi:hypothetical protein
MAKKKSRKPVQSPDNRATVAPILSTGRSAIGNNIIALRLERRDNAALHARFSFVS